MKSTLTKFFQFSASHAQGARIRGHNYRLGVTVDFIDLPEEEDIEKKINQALIHKLESRDLGENVDFLKGQTITDLNLLKTFWRILEPALAPIPLHSLSLERNKQTCVILMSDKS